MLSLPVVMVIVVMLMDSPFKTIALNKLFLLWVTSAMVSYHDNRRVTKMLLLFLKHTCRALFRDTNMYTVLWVDPTLKPLWKRRWFSCTQENDIQWTWTQRGKQISSAVFHIRKIRMKTDFPLKRQVCLTPAPPSYNCSLRGTCAIEWTAPTFLLSPLLSPVFLLILGQPLALKSILRRKHWRW